MILKMEFQIGWKILTKMETEHHSSVKYFLSTNDSGKDLLTSVPK